MITRFAPILQFRYKEVPFYKQACLVTSYSAEIEQKVEQKNILCSDSLCENNVLQTQIPVLIGGESGSNYIKQEAKQSNFACFDSVCSNNLVQTQGVVGSSGSYYEYTKGSNNLTLDASVQFAQIHKFNLILEHQNNTTLDALTQLVLIQKVYLTNSITLDV